ncbi:Crp/Fnr family transcriptional regulator [Streptomyces mirabilis]|uniref:Crp/Fnr family transcriptional regulator n=1 Tax=Streptomyces mirabilis TaxID=68239 RepID=UPI00331C2658
MGARKIHVPVKVTGVAAHSDTDLKATEGNIQANIGNILPGAMPPGYVSTLTKSSLDTKMQELSAAGRSAIGDLAPYFLSISALLELASVARYRVHGRGQSLLIRRSPGYVHFLIDGCVLEETTDSQISRLWRDGAVFGEQEILHSLSPTNQPKPNRTRFLNFLSESRCLLIPREKLRVLALNDPSAMFMLARVGMNRANTIERLYTVTRKSPASRVAALLDYLAGQTTVMRPKTVENEEKQLVVKPMRNAIVEGPTQNDISEALNLGRATVERAVRELRKEGALQRFGKGERTNRVYEIADRDLLQQIAQGG